MANKKDKYIVIEYFVDLQDNNKEYKEGQRFPRPATKKISAERLELLSTDKNRQGKPVIKKEEN